MNPASFRSAPNPVAWLRLWQARGVGPRIGRALVEAVGSVERLFDADDAELARVPGVGPRLLEALRASRAAEAERTLEGCDRAGIRVVVPDDPRYPSLLAQCPDAPLVLFVRGDPAALSTEPMLSVVGARRSSREGRSLARRWCRFLGERGVAITSGMAYGIDTAAHLGALDAGGVTVAVLGCGLMHPLEPRARDLAARIAERGALVSEYAPGQAPRPELFPRRNRIIAGLSVATLVVEAGLASGSLITARAAADAGRDVLAVPGSVLAGLHAGCHQLIRDGAVLVESAEQVLDELGIRGRAAPKSTYRPADAAEARVLAALREGPVHLDRLAEDCGLTVPQLSPILLALELRGVVERLPGSRYLLCMELKDS